MRFWPEANDRLSFQDMSSSRSIITVGNFDGVHLGHRRIISRARELAVRHGVPVRVLTFDPHPASVLRPGSGPPTLMTQAQRVAALTAAGVDEVVVLESTPELLSLDAQQFVTQVVDDHAPVAIVEGPDFRFGKDRVGDVDALKQLGGTLGFEVHIVEKVEVPLCDQLMVTVSSSVIRWLLAHGRVADAAVCMGGSYALSGRVVVGDQRGQKIGVPTANLDSASLEGRAIPGDGVFAGLVELANHRRYPAAISVGCKPTVGGAARTIEAHLLDFEGDLYDQEITLMFGRWLRDQQAFPSLEALASQLKRDIGQTRQWDSMKLFDGWHDKGQGVLVG